MSPSTTPTLRHERALLREGPTWIAAMDEVGRGALAGPVSVGVVLVDPTVKTAPRGLRDSKLLTPEARVALAPRLRRWAPYYAVGHASPEEIDTWGILRALRVAGERALAQITVAPDLVLLDGSYDWLTKPRAGEPTLFDHESAFDPPAYRVTTMVKADLRCASVAAASVLAKTERDAWMVSLAQQHPGYGWETNKGYATPDHWAGLDLHGPCVLHRRSWRPFRPPEEGLDSLDPGAAGSMARVRSDVMPGQNGLDLDDLEELLA